MDKKAIASVLREMGTLLELKGENPFKSRAYHTGARIWEQMEGEAEELITSGALRQAQGIGAALSEKIETLHRTGRLEAYDTLRASIPPGLLLMMEIESLGAKKVKLLYERLGVASIEELEAACQAGHVAALPGFGAKSVARILTGLRNRKAYAKRRLAWKAAPIAEAVLQELQAAADVEAAAVAGSLRRGLETIGDVDLVAASATPESVVEAFIGLKGITAVTARGTTKASVHLEDGLQVDLRVVMPEVFSAALHHFTGSKAHNVQLRRRAREQGWRLSEWGFAPLGKEDEEVSMDATTSMAAELPASEAALFERLGLSFIPPELREGMGEIEAAEAGTLPRLIEPSDIRGVFHVHTKASDGHHTLEEMAAAAEALGWDYLGIADHSKSSVQANGLDTKRLRKQVEDIRALNASGRFRIHVFTGTECDILPDGSLDFEDAVLKELDYVVASVHSAFGQDEAVMTARLIRAIEHPYTTMIGHLTGRLLLRREPYRVDIPKVIDAAIACGKVIELNASPHRLDMDWRLWRRAIDKGLKCSINPDAHSTAALNFYRAGVQAARKGWVTPEAVVNTMELEAITSFLHTTRRRTLKK